MSAAAIAGAAGSIFGQGINWLANQQINEENWRHQMEAWNLTNEYNSPAAQMARFKEAGLNPNLIYGQSNTSMSPAPAKITPEFQFPYQQLGNLLSSSNILETASNEARKWIQTVQNVKESNSRIDLNQSSQFLKDVEKDLAFLKYTSFHQGDYFGKLVDNLAKRNTILKLKSDIDSNTFNFLSRTLDQRIAAIELKNDLMRSQKVLNYSTSDLRKAQRGTELFKPQLMRSQIGLNNAKTQNLGLDYFYNFERNKYSSLIWQGKAAQDFEKALLYGDQRELYQARKAYTNIKAGLAPWEFGLDVLNSLGKLGMEAYKIGHEKFPPPTKPIIRNTKPVFKYR